MRLPFLCLLLVLVLPACAGEIPAPSELTAVEGRYARAVVQDPYQTNSTLALELEGQPRRFTTWLPPQLDDEEDVPNACSGGQVSLRVDAKGEIWEMACKGKSLFTYDQKVGLARRGMGMGVLSLVVVAAVVLGVALLALRARKRPGMGGA